MSKLSNCMSKAGKALDAEDKKRILERRSELVGDGAKQDDAALQAVADRIFELKQEFRELRDQGIVNAMPILPNYNAARGNRMVSTPITATEPEPKFEGADREKDDTPLLSVQDFNEITNMVEDWLFPEPKKGETRSLETKAELGAPEMKDSDYVGPGTAKFTTPSQSRRIRDSWEKAVEAMPKEHPARGSVGTKTVLSLFDATGEWSDPWAQAGYNVISVDLKNGDDIMDFGVQYLNDMYGEWLNDVYAVIAACPCTDFSNAGNKHKAGKRESGAIQQSRELVYQTLATIEYLRPVIWAIENPVGQIKSETGLPSPRLTFHPYHFGDAYTKKTQLYGNFNPFSMPTASVEPKLGSLMHKLGGKDESDAGLRSITPRGFALSFFLGNNMMTMPAEEYLKRRYFNVWPDIQRLMKIGASEREIIAFVDGQWDYEGSEAKEAIQDILNDTDSLGALRSAVDFLGRDKTAQFSVPSWADQKVDDIRRRTPEELSALPTRELNAENRVAGMDAYQSYLLYRFPTRTFLDRLDKVEKRVGDKQAQAIRAADVERDKRALYSLFQQAGVFPTKTRLVPFLKGLDQLDKDRPFQSYLYTPEAYIDAIENPIDYSHDRDGISPYFKPETIKRYFLDLAKSLSSTQQAKHLTLDGYKKNIGIVYDTFMALHDEEAIRYYWNTQGILNERPFEERMAVDREEPPAPPSTDDGDQEGLFRRSGATRTGRTDAQLIRGLKKAPTVKVIDTIKGLPKRIQDQLAAEGTTEIKGYYDRGEGAVYLVRSGNRDADDMDATLLHEAVGHYGIELLFGEDIGKFLAMVYGARMRDPAVKRAFEYVERYYRGAPKAVQVAEAVAYLAETDPKNGLLTRIVQFVKGILRKLGFQTEFTAADIYEAFALAKRAMDGEIQPMPWYIRSFQERQNLAAAEGAASIDYILDRNEVGLYSQLEKALNEMPDFKPTKKNPEGKIKASLILSRLQKAGVKKEELEWSTFAARLQSNPDELWTQEAALEAAEEGRLELIRDELESGTGDSPEGEIWQTPQIYDERDAYEYRIDDLMDGWDNDSIEYELIEFLETLQPDVLEEAMKDYLEANRDSLSESEISEIEESMDGGEEQWISENFGKMKNFQKQMRSEFEEWAEGYVREEYFAGDPYTYTHMNSEYGDYIIFGSDDLGYDLRKGGLEWSRRVEIPENYLSENRIYSISEAKIAFENYLREQGDLNDGDAAGGTIFMDYLNQGLPAYEDYWETLIRVGPHEKIVGEYMKGGHFDRDGQENVVVFSRNTKREIDGVSTYYIDELQSDWHSDARKRGGYSTREFIERRKKRQDEIRDRSQEVFSQIYRPIKEVAEYLIEGNPEYVERGKQSLTQDLIGTVTGTRPSANSEARAALGTRAESKWEYATDAEKEEAEFFQELLESRIPGIAELQVENHALEAEKDSLYVNNFPPDAPFKDSAYINLAVKDALVTAVNRGYRRIAWNDSQAVAGVWGDRYLAGYKVVYDKKMVGAIKKLTGLTPYRLDLDGDTITAEDVETAGGELNMPGMWVIDIPESVAEQIKVEAFPMFRIDDQAQPDMFSDPIGEELQGAAAKLSPTEIDEWRMANRVSQRAGRNRDVEAAARRLESGDLTLDGYNQIVQKHMPIFELRQVPPSPTVGDMSAALSQDKAERIIGVDVKIADGERVASRLDIPAFDFYNTWIVSVHRGGSNTGSSIGYGTHSVLTNVEFKTNPKAALKVATGRSSKAPFARVHGDWQNMDLESARRLAASALKDPAWVQVGQNPFRHSYFYEKRTGQPVVAAEKIVQIGPFVMARGVTYASPLEEQFRVRDTDVFFRRVDETDDERRNARLKGEDRSYLDRGKALWHRALSPGGNLPEKVFDAKIRRDGQIEAGELDTRHQVYDLEHAFKKAFGKSFEKRTIEQERQMRRALAGEANVDLPREVLDVLGAMRAHIDSLSEQYIEALKSDGQYLLQQLPPERRDALMQTLMEMGDEIDFDEFSGPEARIVAKLLLIRTISGNVGRYVHRSYQAYDDPKWFDRIPAPVMNNARRYLKENYIEQETARREKRRKREVNKLAKQLRAEDESLTLKGAKAIADSLVDPIEEVTEAEALERADIAIEDIAKSGTAYDSMESYFKESKLGAKDLSILKRRKVIGDPILALLGEYYDPRLNYAKSVAKMNRLIHNDLLLKDIREVGMGVFLFEEKDRPVGAWKQLSSKGNERYSPLDGLYTTPEVAQAFQDALGHPEDWGRIVEGVIRLNGLVKFGKTVLSPTTTVRNWVSAAFFTLSNAHFNWKHIGRSVKSMKTYFEKDDSQREYLRKLKELGVVYDTPYAGEMMRLLDDAQIENFLNGGKMTARHWLQFAQRLYQFGDDFWKIVGWENEIQLQMKYYGLDREAAEKEAAKRVRNTYPTYSMVGQFMQRLRKFPLAGTFVSFPSEIIRTSYHIVRYAYRDMKQSKALGAQRLAGLAIASGAAYIIQELSKQALGVDDEEEEAIRQQLPPWSRNSNLWFWSREDGLLRYMDLSYHDPYNYWKRPITAMMRDEPPGNRLLSAATDMVKPFFGTDIVAGAVMEVLTNRKSSGGPVYNESEHPVQIAKDSADHILKAVSPGFVNNINRTAKALQGEYRASGQQYSVADEGLAWLGVRVSTLDPAASLKFRAFDQTRDLRSTSAIVSSKIRDPNPVSDEALRTAFDRMMYQREQIFDDALKMVKAARKSGITSTADIQRILASGGYSKDDARLLANGRIPGMRRTPRWMDAAIKSNERVFGRDAGRETRRRRDLVRRWMAEYSSQRSNQPAAA